MKMFNLVLLVLLSHSCYGGVVQKSRDKTEAIPVEDPIVKSPVEDLEIALEKFREQVKDNEVEEEEELTEEVKDNEAEEKEMTEEVKDNEVEEEEEMTEEDCKDDWNNCRGYVKQGFCTHTHVETMKTNCKKSCGYCNSDNGCRDNDNSCGSWANRSPSECKVNPGWMLENCKKSCGVCTGEKKKVKEVDNGCKPKYSNCEEHKRNGVCDTYPKWMKKYCCGLCKESNGCKPKYTNCKEHAERNGYCEKHPQWMKDNCCGKLFCKESATKESGTKGSGTKESGTKEAGAKGAKSTGDKQKDCLASANSYRSKHRNTPLLEWDQDLADKAQAYAELLLRKGIANGGNVWPIMKHDPANGPEGMGENLWYEDWYEPGDDSHYCRKADKSWYDEIKDYWFSLGKGNGGVVTHFTQMVWVNTKKVGYGVAVGDSVRNTGNKIAIVVAKYTPKGNWGDEKEFQKNVQYEK